jgi:hypothetical protein
MNIAMSLYALKIASIARELTTVDKSLESLVMHVRFLATKCVADNLDLGTVNELRHEALRVKGRLADMASSLESAKRAGRRVDNGHQSVASARGMVRHVDQHLLTLERELGRLSTAVECHINEPGRYGDGALTTAPLVELYSFLQTALELLHKTVERRRHARRG